MAYDISGLDEVSQVILKARELLSDPAKWHQGSFCQKGAYCLLGAIGVRKFYDNDELGPVIERIASALPASFQPKNSNEDRVWMFNDEHRHADVLALLDRAALSAASPQEKGE